MNQSEGESEKIFEQERKMLKTSAEKRKAYRYEYIHIFQLLRK